MQEISGDIFSHLYSKQTWKYEEVFSKYYVLIGDSIYFFEIVFIWMNKLNLLDKM